MTSLGRTKSRPNLLLLTSLLLIASQTSSSTAQSPGKFVLMLFTLFPLVFSNMDMSLGHGPLVTAKQPFV